MFPSRRAFAAGAITSVVDFFTTGSVILFVTTLSESWPKRNFVVAFLV
jgi:hypothetical protein